VKRRKKGGSEEIGKNKKTWGETWWMNGKGSAPNMILGDEKKK